MKYFKTGILIGAVFLLLAGNKAAAFIKSETQTGIKSEVQTERQTETQSETGSEIQSESQTETESEIQSESQTETESETQSESQTETESETHSESQTETESETQSESQSEMESETQSETQTESETELPREVIVENLKTIYKGDSREFDDTNRVELKADVRGLPEGMQVLLAGKSKHRRVGTWEVEVSCKLAGKDSEKYSVKVEKNNLIVHIVPRVLNIRIAEGRKPYFSENNIQLLEFDESPDEIVKVSGFVKNGKAVKESPKGFQKPGITIDERILKPDSPMYDQGALKKYGRALVVKRDKKGNITGNTTDNYCYDLQKDSALYHPGSVTLVKNSVSEIKDYQVLPESKEGFLRNEDGKILVKKGMRLKIIPNERAGYNQVIISNELKENGVFSFELERRDETGKLLAQSGKQSVTYEVDDQPPTGLTILANEKKLSSGMGERAFFNGNVRLKFTGYLDVHAGIRSVQYWISEITEASRQKLSGIQESYESQKSLWRTGISAELVKEGEYQVFVRVEDNVGNASFFGGNTILIDKTTPRITVDGVSDLSANSGVLELRIQCEDDYYWKGSLETVLIGEKNGEKKLKYERKKSDRGELLIFEQIPEKKEWDDYYVLYISAGDQAGNIAAREIHFSVNRFGSVYTLGKETREQMDNYYCRKPFDVEIREVNVDKLEEAQLTITRDGELRILNRDKEYLVKKIEGKYGYKEYRYIIPAKNFQDEGAYAVSLNSIDMAGNVGDNKLQKKYIEFVIDKTPPSIMIAGLDDKSFYPEEVRDVVIDARDNAALQKMLVYLDGDLIKSSLNQETSFTILQKDKWRDLEVLAIDKAGNEAKKKIAFCISKTDNGRIAVPQSLEHFKEKKLFGKGDKEIMGKETFTIPEVINQGEGKQGDVNDEENGDKKNMKNEFKGEDKKKETGYAHFGIKALMIISGALIGAFSYRRWGRRRSKE